MVYQPWTLLPNRLVGLILHQPKRNADHRQQQPLVQCHDKSEFNFLQQIARFVAPGQPEPHPKIHEPIDDSNACSTATDTTDQIDSRFRTYVAHLLCPG
jgi:hypothetical protein